MKKKEIKTAARTAAAKIGELTFKNIKLYVWEIYQYKIYRGNVNASTAAYVDHKNKLIAVSNQVKEEYAIQLLLHEIGHIALQHEFNFAGDETKAELEADYFATYILKAKQRKRITVAIGIATIVCGVSLGVIGTLDTPATNTTYENTEQLEDINTTEQLYVITRTGEKYHKPSCQYVQNKTNTITITLDEAINSGYEPCKVCIY